MIKSGKTPPTVAQSLARFIGDLSYAQIPAGAVSRCRELLLDQLGCQLIGAAMPWNQPVYRFVKSAKGGGPARIVKYGDQVPTDDAVLVNGTFAQGCELDDYYDQGGGHPGAATVPVILALAQQQTVSGQELITAMVAGYEVGWRIGRALLPELMTRGYHAQSAVGVFIAAAAAGKILRLDPEQMTHALAIAGSHSGGTMEYDQSGGEVKRVIAGIGARGGIQSAMLAQLGLTGPPTIIEGKRGFLKVFADLVEPEEITRDLGSEFKIMRIWFKLYPCVATVQGVIYTLGKLIEEHRFGADDVEEIRVGISETSLSHGGAIYEPHDTASAQFSLPFSLAIRLLKNDNDLSFYMDSKLWTDPKVLALARKVKSYADPDAKKDQNYNTTMEVKVTDGKTYKAFEPYPPGSPLDMVSRDVLRAKFRKMARAVLPEDRIDRLIDAVDRLETCNDTGELLPLVVK